MQNKLWNVSALLYNEDLSSTPPSFDYSLNIVDTDGNTVNLWNPIGFYFLIVTNFTSFCYLTPRFYDPESEQLIDFASDIMEAIGLFRETYSAWVASRKPAIERLYQALRAEYNPIWNVDGVEGHIHQATHTGTDTDTKTGTENIYTEDNGNITSTGKTTNTRTGNETAQPAGTETATTAKTTFDDDNFENTQKITISFSNDRLDTTTYNDVKDTYVIDGSNPLKENHDLDGKHNTTFNTQLRKTLNLADQDLDMTIRQGNIGVTKSQDLVMSEKDVRDIDDIINYAIYDFVHRNLVLR